MPAAGLAAISAEEASAEFDKLPSQRPGQYRTSIELLEIGGPPGSKDILPSMRSTLSKGSGNATERCISPEEANDRGQFRGPGGDECAFDHVSVDGETFTASMQCPVGSTASRIKLSGRSGAERTDVTVTMERKVPARPPLRMKMRMISERIGECD